MPSCLPERRGWAASLTRVADARAGVSDQVRVLGALSARQGDNTAQVMPLMGATLARL